MKPRNDGVEIRATATKNSNMAVSEMVLAIQVSIDDLEGVRASHRLLVGDLEGVQAFLHLFLGNRYRQHLELETSLEKTSIGAGRWTKEDDVDWSEVAGEDLQNSKPRVRDAGGALAKMQRVLRFIFSI
ncbi:unnamed protein product [Linum trigynum]|uniref:Uncharacterized protein n=1 Tax=Linum trigynum TaxID=586398 RepID=A0AAV2EA82_9ROSI